MSDYYELEPSKSEFKTLSIQTTYKCQQTCSNCYLGEMLNNSSIPDVDIIKFEKAINNHEKSLGNELHELNPTKHSFADGQYIREIYNPAGLVLVTKIHNKTHPFFLMKGEMSIITEEGAEKIKAPYQGITKAGTKRVIYTHSECVFITVHRTDTLSVKEIEKEVIADSFDNTHLSVPNTDDIHRLIKEMI